MKTKTLLLSMLAAISTVAAHAQQTIDVSTPGTLSTLITADENIGQLKLTGTINKQDFTFIDGLQSITALDLSEVSIAEYTDNDSGITYPANEIPADAFNNRTHQNDNGATVEDGNKVIKHFVLPATITAIGARAFNNGGAESVDFSLCQQLAVIHDHAFEFNSELTEINLSGLSALQTIEEYAFDQSHASTISLSGCSSLTTIEKNAFSQSYYCTSIDFSACTALQFIGNRAFLNLGKYIGNATYGIDDTPMHLDLSPCTALETIDESAFQSAKITALTLPANLKAINNKAFNLTTKLTAITFLGTEPPTLGTTAFTNKEMTNEAVTVSVPEGSEEAYAAAGFENVATAIALTTMQPAALSQPIYDLQGRQATPQQRGIVIVGGKKVVMKR